MVTVTLRGKVVSGIGEGRAFTSLDWAKRQFRGKLGFNPYAGTLNIRTIGEENIELLRSSKGIQIDPPKGFFGGKCFTALIGRRICGAVVIPDSSTHPSNVLEIIAAVSLRKELNLDDGDEVDVQVRLE